MLIIQCPWCGPRNDAEFSYGGEAGIVRPENPAALSDEEWAQYLYMRNNKRGTHVEQWCHQAGCRRWFEVVRDTVSNRISGIYKVGEPLPKEIAHGS
jgi:heterotetrameric sarcosine oxidase delta subunit